MGKFDAEARRFSAGVGHFEGRIVEFHPHNQRQAGTRVRLRGATSDQKGEREKERDQARGVDVIAATPGRLLDHLEQGTASLADVEILVLDEVDRMLDMGFLPDVKRIIQRCPKARQTLFFSATMPPELAQLSTWALINPQEIKIGQRRSAAFGRRAQDSYWHDVFCFACHETGRVRRCTACQRILRRAQPPAELSDSRCDRSAFRSQQGQLTRAAPSAS